MNLHISSPEEAEVNDPKHDLITKVVLNIGRPEKCVGIGSELDENFKNELVQFLRDNITTFAWSMEDMKGIDPKITCHELNVDPTFKRIKQKRQTLGQERAQAVNNEVKRLLEAGSIAEVKYP